MGFFSKKTEFTFKDREFKGLTIFESRTDEWINLVSPKDVTDKMHLLFGSRWRQMPFVMIPELLKLRFGHEFISLNQKFGFQNLYFLQELVDSLNKNQLDFLKENNFLPHRYFTKFQEKEVIEKRIKNTQILIDEFTSSQEEERIKDAQQAKKELEKQLKEINLKIERYSESDFQKPISEHFLDNFVELKEWSQDFVDLLQEKKLAFDFASKMSALNRENQKLYEFGHWEERVQEVKKRRIEEDRKKAEERKRAEELKKQESFQAKSGSSQSYANSTTKKVWEAKTMTKNKPVEVVINQKKQALNTLVKELAQKTEEAKIGNQRAYQDVSDRIFQQKSENKTHKQQKNIWVKVAFALSIITIAIIILLNL